MLRIYPACFYREKNGQVSVVFPDLAYRATYGNDVDEAMKMAVDLLASYIFTLEQEGSEIKRPSDISEIRLDNTFDYKEGFVSLVSVDVEEYAKNHFEKPIKKTVTIPKWLNDRAVSEHVNFSNLLKEALLKHLHL